MRIELTQAAQEPIARQGFDPVYRTRPLRRYISQEVETSIGRALLCGELGDRLVIIVDAGDGELVVNYTATQDRSAA
jgi:ATP-dependent Clp protease ATP-binding subunit ClpB